MMYHASCLKITARYLRGWTLHSSSRGTNTSRATTRLGSQRLSFPGCGDQAVPQPGRLRTPRPPGPSGSAWKPQSRVTPMGTDGEGQSGTFWNAGNVLHLDLSGDYAGDVYTDIKPYTEGLYTSLYRMSWCLKKPGPLVTMPSRCPLWCRGGLPSHRAWCPLLPLTHMVMVVRLRPSQSKTLKVKKQDTGMK